MAAAFHFGLAFSRLGELVGFVSDLGGRGMRCCYTLIGAATSGSSILFLAFCLYSREGMHITTLSDMTPFSGTDGHTFFTISAWQLSSSH